MITKLKFNINTKPSSRQNKLQEISPYDKKIPPRRSSHHQKEFLIPLEKFPTRHLNSKPIHSEGKSKQIYVRTSEKQKIPTVDLVTLKNSFFLRKDRDSIQLKSLSRKKPETNRIYTEKAKGQDQWIQPQKEPINRNKKSVHKILLRAGYSKSKETSPNTRKTSSNEKVLIFDNFQNRISDRLSTKTNKSQKKLTAFQRQQIQNFEVFYIGSRRITSKSDFTDSEGDPKVVVGDSIAYRYQIVSQLGRGSFGQVYKALDHKKKEYVALKLIKSQAKFLRQAKVQVQILQCALLNDPKLKCNVVRMKGSFVFRNHSCITFEILHKNLYEFLKENNFSGFSLDLIRRFAIQILQCLYFFANNNIVHCDLKPQNILLKQQNKSGIRVIDVGSGCFQPKQIYTYIQSRFYRAPEIILGIRYTPAIDMWSFGCILVELFTGFPIFPGDSENQQMLMFMQVLGSPPFSMLQVAERRKKFFTETFECKIPQQKGKQRVAGSMNLKDVVGTNDREFLNLIKRCLEWDPSKRITPKEALLHEWIVNGLPPTIRDQHIDQVNDQSV